MFEVYEDKQERHEYTQTCLMGWGEEGCVCEVGRRGGGNVEDEEKGGMYVRVGKRGK